MAIKNNTRTYNWASYILTSTTYKKSDYLNNPEKLKDNQALVEIYESLNEYKVIVRTNESMKSANLGSLLDVIDEKIYVSNYNLLKETYCSSPIWDVIENNLGNNIDEVLISASDDFLYTVLGFNFNSIFSKKKNTYVGLAYKIIYLL